MLQEWKNKYYRKLKELNKKYNHKKINKYKIKNKEINLTQKSIIYQN